MLLLEKALRQVQLKILPGSEATACEQCVAGFIGGRVMVDKARALLTAQNLMERALELLDDVQETRAAVHLQMAVDILTGAPIPRSLEEAEALLDTAQAKDILQRVLHAEADRDD